MKLVNGIVALLVGLALAVEPSVANPEAAVHLRVNAKRAKICYKACPKGQYCAVGTTVCRPPYGDECFSTATYVFRKGCDPGMQCINGQCKFP